MARIPDSELERLKKEVRLEDLAAGRGIELRRHGADLLDEGVPQGVPRGQTDTIDWRFLPKHRSALPLSRF